MASIRLAKPGTKFGPCKKKSCDHIDCESTRALAAQVCRLCDETIGYDRRFYGDLDIPERYVHASCLEDLVERERKARLKGAT